MSQPDSARTVEKALDVLVAMADAERPLRVADIAERASVSPTSAYRILRALESRGATLRLPSGSHELGGLIGQLAAAIDHDGLLRLAAAGTMLHLQGACGDETVGLYTRLNTAQMVCIDVLAGRHSIRHVEPMNVALPIAGGATSSVFLAEKYRRQGKAAVESYLRGLPRSIRPPSLAATLRRLRYTDRYGWTATSNERIPGASALAAGIRTEGGVLLGAITLSGPEYRFTAESVERWSAILIAGAERIARVATA